MTKTTMVTLQQIQRWRKLRQRHKRLWICVCRFSHSSPTTLICSSLLQHLRTLWWTRSLLWSKINLKSLLWFHPTSSCHRNIASSQKSVLRWVTLSFDPGGSDRKQMLSVKRLQMSDKFSKSGAGGRGWRIDTHLNLWCLNFTIGHIILVFAGK
jgi:hypothetical protein